MRKFIQTAFAVVLLVCAVTASLRAQEERSSEARPLARILLVPLDDRPPCLQFTEMIARVGDAEVVAPPRSLLGRFTEPGRPAEIAAWVRSQDLRRFDAVILSLDMLAYGGLVGSRVGATTTLPAAVGRLELVRWLRSRAPRLPVYGFNVIMRLAPTADGRNEAYREKLSRWAEISPDAARRDETARLEREIPAPALADYRRARERNLAVNRAGVEMVRDRLLDYLILAQDDAKPRGVHVADRERLLEMARSRGVTERVTVQPGADEVASLLLARALNRKFNYAPRILARYSSAAVRDGVAPYEDRPLHRTVSSHIAATGGREVREERAAEIIFYVYGSRAEPGAAGRFAAEVARDAEAGRRVIVADIDFKGDVQGADPVFTEELRRRNLFPLFSGYASWNTAGNTIGTALPHGVVFARVFAQLPRFARARRARIARAQLAFMLHRLIDDYAYHSLVRPEANRYARAQNLNPNHLAGEDQLRVEAFIRERMRPHVDDLWKGLAGQRTAIGEALPVRFSDFQMTLPWGRTFEALVDFRLEVSDEEDK